MLLKERKSNRKRLRRWMRKFLRHLRSNIRNQSRKRLNPNLQSRQKKLIQLKMPKMKVTTNIKRRISRKHWSAIRKPLI